MTTTTPGAWRKCSNCKSEIALGAKYWICSVSTCQRQRAPIQFCKTDCWDVHNEIENHRDGWAVEKLAPTAADAAPSRPVASAKPAAAPSAASVAPKAPAVRAPSTASATPAPASGDGEILVVVSRFKEYIAESHGMRCSDDVAGQLSDHLRKIADESIEAARRAGRKTVLDRDVPRPPAEGDVPVLVVVSKLKAYVTAKSDMRTSDEVIPVLTAELRRLGGRAVETARADGRKTVLGRDVPRP